jgi:hypothetical protein
VRIPIQPRIHLSWTFQLRPTGDTTSFISPLARTGLFSYSLVRGLLDIIAEKDGHIVALQEKLKDLGGGYYPRKHRDALERFDEGKWREERRRGMGRETGWRVFEQWGEVGEEERKDWEVIAAGLTGWKDESDKVFPGLS